MNRQMEGAISVIAKLPDVKWLFTGTFVETQVVRSRQDCPPVAVAIFSASVIRSNYDHPLFIKIGLAILHGFPDTGNLIVRFPYIFIEKGSVAGNMPRIVGVPQIYPAQVGRIFADTFRGTFRDLFVYIEVCKSFSFFGKRMVSRS